MAGEGWWIFRAYLVIAIQLEILFWPECTGLGMLGLGLDALGDVGHDLSSAEHAVGIKTIVSGTPCQLLPRNTGLRIYVPVGRDGWQYVLVWL